MEYINLVYDLATKTVKKNNVSVKQTSTELELHALFAKNEGKIITLQHSLNKV